MSWIILITTLAVSLIVGYTLYQLVLKLIPIYLLSQPRLLANNITKEAHKQSTNLLKQKPSPKKIEISREKINEDINAQIETLAHETELLNLRKEELKQKERLLQQKEHQVQQLTERHHATQQQFTTAQSSWGASCEDVHQALAQRAGNSCSDLSQRLKHDFIHHHTLEYQKVSQFMESELNAQARKKADMVLTNVHSRYSPDFAWPKISNIVTEVKKGDIETILEGNNNLIDELRELAGVEIAPITEKSDQGRVTAMKFAGGFGIYKEAAKLTLNHYLTKKKSVNGFVTKEIYANHLSRLNKEARRLGKKAVTNLGLHNVHPELQYLIGALNWRTSYRQNQWLHTMEVAVLAGIIAEEIGEDAHAAKRSGLLHDIGKALDYRIDGSHAIISGDYADRFGESKLVCDTVMSHHSDLVVENPLAFTLMAADTLSGARPGARVNIEEGYQLRLSSITDTVKSFPGVDHLNIMNGGREVHVSVQHHQVSEKQARHLARQIAEKIEADVSYPSQIKVQLSRVVQSQAVA